MMINSRSVKSRATVTEELVKGLYLKRIPVAGAQESFVSLHDREVVLGRFMCSSPHISWQHVLFKKTENDEVFIKDLKSVNGTFLNGKRISAECIHPVHVGDRITLGKKNITLPIDFEFELCCTQQPLKLKVIGTLQSRECVTLKSCENRRHIELHESAEEKADDAENALLRSCSENLQPKGTIGRVTATLNQPSSSGNVTRTSNWLEKRPGESSQVSKRPQSPKEKLRSSAVEDESVTVQKCPPSKINMAQDNRQKSDYRFGKEVVQGNGKENHIEHQTMENESFRCTGTLEMDVRNNSQLAECCSTCTGSSKKEILLEKPIENHIYLRTTKNESVPASKCSPLEINVTLEKLQKGDCHFGKEIVQLEKHNQHQIRATNPPLEIDLTLDDSQKEDDRFVKVVKEKPVENYTECRISERNPPLEIDAMLEKPEKRDFGKEVVQKKAAEKRTEHQRTAKNLPLEIDITLDDPQEGDDHFGKVIDENLVEKHTEHQRTEKDPPLAIDIRLEDPQKGDDHFRKVVDEKLVEKHNEHQGTEKNPPLAIDIRLEDPHKGDYHFGKVVDEKLIEKHTEHQRTEKNLPLEIDITLDDPQKGDDHYGKVVDEKLVEKHTEHQRTAKTPPLEIGIMLDDPQKGDDHFGKFVDEKLVEKHTEHQRTEKNLPLEIDITIDDPQKGDDHFVKIVQEKPVENHTQHRTETNSPLEIGATLDIPAKGDSHFEEVVQEKPVEKPTEQRIEKNLPLEIDQMQEEPLKGDHLFGNFVQEKPVEIHTQKRTETNPPRLRRNCYVNLIGSNEFVKSYMKNRMEKRKDSNRSMPYLSSSESAEETTSFVKQRNEHVSVKPHRKHVSCHDSDEDRIRNDLQASVKHQNRNKLCEKEAHGSRAAKRKHFQIIDSDEELTNSYMQQKIRLKKRRTDSKQTVLYLSSSESEVENSSRVKQQVEDGHIFSKHCNKYKGNESVGENTSGYVVTKRKRLMVIDSDEESGDIPVHVPPTFSSIRDRNFLGMNAGSQNTNGDLVMSSHSESDTSFMSSSSCDEAKTMKSYSHSLKKGENEQSFSSEVVQNIKKEPLDYIDRRRGQQNSDGENDCYIYSQVDEIIIISSDEDDHPISCSSKSKDSSTCNVYIKSEPVDSDNELDLSHSNSNTDSIDNTKKLHDLSHSNSNTDSIDNTKKLQRTIPENEHIKFQCTGDPYESDYSEIPKLSESFSDVTEDEINKHKQEKSSVPGPSNAKLDKLIQRNRMKKVNTTSFTEALPNVERRHRRNGWIEESHVEVKEAHEKRSHKLNWISKRGRQTKDVGNSRQRPKKKDDIRNKILEQQGHRIRMPGGGSDYRSSPTSDDSQTTQILKTTTPKPQSIGNEPKQKSKVREKPIVNSLVPKMAHKMAAQQRFTSRQEGLIEDVTLKPGNSSEIYKISNELSLSQYKIPLKPKPVQKIPLKPKPVQKILLKPKPVQNCKILQGTDKRSAMSSVDNGRARLGQTNQVLHRVGNLKITGTGTSNAPSVTTPEPRAGLAENSQIPNTATEKSAMKSPNGEDPRLIVSKYPKLKNTSSLAPKVTPSESFRNLDVMHKILNWKTVWLKEQQRCNTKIPPPVVDQYLLREVALSYTSIDEYCNTYYPLLMLEIWASVYNDWRTKNRPCVKMCIKNCCMKDDLWELQCQTVISNANSESLKLQMEGYLVIIPLRIVGTNEAHPVFGYVTEYKTESLEHVAVPPLIGNCCEKSNNGRLATCIIKVVSRSWTVDLRQPVKVESTSNIKPKLRQMDAIFALSKNVLVRDVLCGRRDFFVLSHEPHEKLISLGDFNQLQEEAILGAADAVSKPYGIPQIKLLQGPPGTGKTSTIIGLVQQILHSNISCNQKLLVVSSSNGAVDEIARRLIKIRERLKKEHPSRRFRLVRVGLSSEISTDVKTIWIDGLAWKNLVNKSDTEDSVKQNIKKEDEIISKLEQKLDNIHVHVSPDKRSALENEKLHHLKLLNFYRNQLGMVEKSLSHHSPAFQNTVKEVLENADVILSTINSCGQSILESAAVKFTCCIVDDATQCTEPEVLTPLHYGITKLILVGDITQLSARIACQKASSLKFHVSYFERVFKFFQRNCDISPVLMLTEQYRMHSEIARFPSQHFYAQKLCTPQMLDRKYSTFPLKPYVCIDMPEGKESSVTGNGTNIGNPYETILMVKLIESLLGAIPFNSSVGVITLNKGQRAEILALLKKQESVTGNKLDINNQLEIESVNGFQGREKDVIILSCAHTESNVGFLSDSQRMNVAITRARQCFLICGNLKLLYQHEHWKLLIHDAFRRNVVIKMTTADTISSVIEKLKNS